MLCFFQKMVTADRVAIFVDTVYLNIMIYNSYELLVVAIGFSIQIYYDFSNYSNIAVGAEKIMGLKTSSNKWGDIKDYIYVMIEYTSPFS